MWLRSDSVLSRILCSTSTRTNAWLAQCICGITLTSVYTADLHSLGIFVKLCHFVQFCLLIIHNSDLVYAWKNNKIKGKTTTDQMYVGLRLHDCVCTCTFAAETAGGCKKKKKKKGSAFLPAAQIYRCHWPFHQRKSPGPPGPSTSVPHPSIHRPSSPTLTAICG